MKVRWMGERGRHHKACVKGSMSDENEDGDHDDRQLSRCNATKPTCCLRKKKRREKKVKQLTRNRSESEMTPTTPPRASPK